MGFRNGKPRANRPVVAGLLLCCAMPAQAETIDELYAKARTEKSLVFYSGGPVAPYETFAKEFEQRFPGVTISMTGGFSNALNDKINAQMKENKLEVDMAFFQTAQDFVAWKKQGVLLAFKPDGYEQIAPAFRDADGAFTVTKVNAITYAYNSKLVAPQDAPRSALDFLKPQFIGKLITRPMTTRHSISSTPSCRNTAGTTWINTWPTSRPSCRAISACRAA